MFAPQACKVFLLGLVLASLPFSMAKEVKARSTAGVLRGGRGLYDGNMDSFGDGDHMNNHDQQHNNDMMDSDETNSTGGGNRNDMMYSDENDTDGVDNITSWDDNSSGNHNHRFGEFVAPSARQCSTQQNSYQVQCACKSNVTDMMPDFEDELKFGIRATRGEYLTILVEYEPTGEMTHSKSNDTGTQFTLVYDRLLEYRKIGSAVDNHYEWGIDEVVAEWPLNDWDELSAVPSTDNLIIYSAKTSMATFMFTIAQTDLNDITTNKMKIDFLLENYPWDASGNTYVALVSRIETQCEIETYIEDGRDKVSDVMINFEDAVETIGFVPFGEYTWATTAEATTLSNVMDSLNGTDLKVERGVDVGENQTTTIAVIASIPSTTKSGTTDNANSSSKEIAFSFVGAGQGANRIYWDPEAGIGYTSSSSSSSSTSIVASVVVSVASFSFAWWM